MYSNHNMKSGKEKILIILIAAVSVMIVVALAIGVSLVRSELEKPEPAEPAQTTQQPAEEELVDEEALIEAHMNEMHEEGYAEVSPEERAIMEQMHTEVMELTPEEEVEIQQNMKEMLEASS